MLLLLACVWSPQVGCGRASGNVTVTAPGAGDSFSGCDTILIESSDPQNGQDDFYYYQAPSVVVSGDVGDVELSVFTVRRNRQISGSTVRDGDTATFMLNEPLSPSTAYLLVVESCGMLVEIKFSTSAFGEVVDNMAVLEGKTFLYPQELDDLFAGLFLPSLGVSVVGDLWLLVAPFQLETQDMCLETVATRMNFDENPYFYASLGDVWVRADEFENVVVPVHDVWLYGSFAADGSGIGGAWMRGVLDGRDEVWASMGDFCMLMVSLGQGCGVCSDGVVSCVELESGYLDVVVLDGGVVEVVDPVCDG